MKMSSKSKVIQAIESEQMGKEIPPFAPGDTIIVRKSKRRHPRASAGV